MKPNDNKKFSIYNMELQHHIVFPAKYRRKIFYKIRGWRVEKC